MQPTPNELRDQMAEVAVQATRMAAEQFNAELDFSGDSLQMVEAILREFRQDFPPAADRVAEDMQEIEDSIATISSLLGAYVGEVVRRNVGGKWQVQESDGESLLTLHVGEHILSPPIDVFDRLTGPDDQNLWEQYRKLFPELESPDEQGGPGLVQLG